MKTYLQSFGILTPKEIDTFEQLAKHKSLKKNDFFIQEGSICQEVAFVQSGYLRSFYYTSTAEDVNYCFPAANSFVTALSSFIAQTPTPENIQALTDVELLSFSRSEIKELEATSMNWATLMKTLTEQEYMRMERRIFLLQRESAEKRYQELITHQPELLQNIPLHHIASYLGITQRHLSRIRGTI